MFLIINNDFLNVEHIKRLFVCKKGAPSVKKSYTNYGEIVEITTTQYWLHIFVTGCNTETPLDYINKMESDEDKQKELKKLKSWLSYTLGSGSNLGNVQLNTKTGYMGVPYAEEDNE